MLNQENLQLTSTFVQENAKAIAELFIKEIDKGNKHKLIGFINRFRFSFYRQLSLYSSRQKQRKR